MTSLEKAIDIAQWICGGASPWSNDFPPHLPLVAGSVCASTHPEHGTVCGDGPGALKTESLLKPSRPTARPTRHERLQPKRLRFRLLFDQLNFEVGEPIFARGTGGTSATRGSNLSISLTPALGPKFSRIIADIKMTSSQRTPSRSSAPQRMSPAPIEQRRTQPNRAGLRYNTDGAREGDLSSLRGAPADGAVGAPLQEDEARNWSPCLGYFAHRSFPRATYSSAAPSSVRALLHLAPWYSTGPPG